MRDFLVRYRYAGPLVIIAVTVLVLVAGVGGLSGGQAYAAAFGIGVLTAAVLCLCWDLWLNP